MKRQALVIGINRYPCLKESSTSEDQNLTTAAADAEAMACLLETHGNFDVRRFPESSIDGKMQVDPKKLGKIAELEDAIEQLFLPEGERIPDVALLYFAGHGFRDKPRGGILQGYLGTSEANPRKEIWGVSLKRIQDILKKSPVKQQIIFLDCCKSGELFNFAPENLADSDKVRFFVTAARPFENAHSKKNEHGALTEILLAGLDPSAKGVVTSLTLSKFIKQQPLQVPQEPIIYCDKQLPIYLTATPEKKHLLEQSLKKGQVSSAAMMRDGRTLSRPEYNNRQELLSRVKYEVDDQLKYSLHNAMPINLGKEKNLQQVKRPWDVEIKVGSSPTVQLPQDTAIIDVFDDETIAGKLLILGAPGSGKTTTLLELAQKLIERAEFDANEPIPIILNLATWKDSKQSIVDWLKFEIKDKHKVIPEKFIAKWIRERDFLPLLDGLDELNSIGQQKCVEAINDFVTGEYQPRKIVLCSRKEEYEFHKSRLILNNSVFLQPLTEAQKREYLESFGLTAIWAKIKDRPVIIELISAPLFISIMRLAYRSISVEEWSKYDSLEESKQYLFKVYIYEMFRKDIKNIWYSSIRKIPNSEMAKYWLTWLSQKLKENNDTEFLIERMQPNWLNNLSLSKMYFINVGLIGSLIGGLFIGPLWLTSSLMVKDIIQEMIKGNNIQQLMMAQMEKLLFFPKETLQNNYYYIVLAITLISGVISLLLSKFVMEIKPVEIIKIVNPKPVLYASLVGLFCLVIFVLINTVPYMLNFHPLIWVIVVFVCQAFQQVIEDSIKSMAEDIMSKDIFIGLLEKEKKSIPNQGIKNSLINAAFLGGILLLIGTILGFLSGHIMGLIFWLSSGIETGNISGITFAHLGGMIGLIFGSLFPSFPCIQHLALRIVFWSNGYIPWNYARFLNYCTERMIIQRVGGRYRFIHRLLQEHFANMELVELSNKTDSN